jgi:hypothetical protein
MSSYQNRKRIAFVGHTPGTVCASSGDGVAKDSQDAQDSVRYVYLLSPANAKGRRAAMLFNPGASFELAGRLRTSGISLGDAFSFMSALYFRGKLAYTSTFARGSNGIPGTLIITPCRGLLAPETRVSLKELVEISAERIVASNRNYRDPLERDLRQLAQTLGADCRVVLLGSIATQKYVPLLVDVFGERLFVPRAFVGLGNMSRGSLLLRCAREGTPLEYVRVLQVIAQGLAK